MEWTESIKKHNAGNGNYLKIVHSTVLEYTIVGYIPTNYGFSQL